jgi:hypothetical protein
MLVLLKKKELGSSSVLRAKPREECGFVLGGLAFIVSTFLVNTLALEGRTQQGVGLWQHFDLIN